MESLFALVLMILIGFVISGKAETKKNQRNYTNYTANANTYVTEAFSFDYSRSQRLSSSWAPLPVFQSTKKDLEFDRTLILQQ